MKSIAALLDGQLEFEDAKALVLELSEQPITTELLVNLAQAMRERMVKLDLGAPVLDTCGTGGDGLKTFNLSTAVALQCAKLGVAVAKHGNVAATSVSGSADVLEELGIPITLEGDAAVDYFQQHHFVFLFAKLYHPAMKFVAPIRKAIGKKTIFNILGPLCNPAGAEYQLIGVSDERLAQPMGEALLTLGSKHIVIVHSEDGLDEASITAPTHVYDFRPYAQKRFTITSQQTYALSELQVKSVQESARLITQPTPAAQAAINLNLKLALYAADYYDHLN